MQIKRKGLKGGENSVQIKQLETYCPFCRLSFLPENAAVLGENQASWLIHVTCNSCSSSIIQLLMLGEVGISSVGLVTDLLQGELEKFRYSQPVTIDDLIDLHLQFKQTNIFLTK